MASDHLHDFTGPNNEPVDSGLHVDPVSGMKEMPTTHLTGFSVGHMRSHLSADHGVDHAVTMDLGPRGLAQMHTDAHEDPDQNHWHSAPGLHNELSYKELPPVPLHGETLYEHAQAGHNGILGNGVEDLYANHAKQHEQGWSDHVHTPHGVWTVPAAFHPIRGLDLGHIVSMHSIDPASPTYMSKDELHDMHSAFHSHGPEHDAFLPVPHTHEEELAKNPSLPAPSYEGTDDANMDRHVQDWHGSLTYSTNQKVQEGLHAAMHQGLHPNGDYYPNQVGEHTHEGLPHVPTFANHGLAGGAEETPENHEAMAKHLVAYHAFKPQFTNSATWAQLNAEHGIAHGNGFDKINKAVNDPAHLHAHTNEPGQGEHETLTDDPDLMVPVEGSHYGYAQGSNNAATHMQQFHHNQSLPSGTYANHAMWHQMLHAYDVPAEKHKHEPYQYDDHQNYNYVAEHLNASHGMDSDDIAALGGPQMAHAHAHFDPEHTGKTTFPHGVNHATVSKSLPPVVPPHHESDDDVHDHLLVSHGLGDAAVEGLTPQEKHAKHAEMHSPPVAVNPMKLANHWHNTDGTVHEIPPQEIGHPTGDAMSAHMMAWHPDAYFAHGANDAVHDADHAKGGNNHVHVDSPAMPEVPNDEIKQHLTEHHGVAQFPYGSPAQQLMHTQLHMSNTAAPMPHDHDPTPTIKNEMPAPHPLDTEALVKHISGQHNLPFVPEADHASLANQHAEQHEKWAQGQFDPYGFGPHTHGTANLVPPHVGLDVHQSAWAMPDDALQKHLIHAHGQNDVANEYPGGDDNIATEWHAKHTALHQKAFNNDGADDLTSAHTHMLKGESPMPMWAAHTPNELKAHMLMSHPGCSVEGLTDQQMADQHNDAHDHMSGSSDYHQHVPFEELAHIHALKHHMHSNGHNELVSYLKGDDLETSLNQHDEQHADEDSDAYEHHVHPDGPEHVHATFPGIESGNKKALKEHLTSHPHGYPHSTVDGKSLDDLVELHEEDHQNSSEPAYTDHDHYDYANPHDQTEGKQDNSELVQHLTSWPHNLGDNVYDYEQDKDHLESLHEQDHDDSSSAAHEDHDHDDYGDPDDTKTPKFEDTCDHCGADIEKSGDGDWEDGSGDYECPHHPDNEKDDDGDWISGPYSHEPSYNNYHKTSSKLDVLAFFEQAGLGS